MKTVRFLLDYIEYIIGIKKGKHNDYVSLFILFLIHLFNRYFFHFFSIPINNGQ